VQSTSARVAVAAGSRARNYRWRVVDIVVASVIGVAAGLVFWLWDQAYNPLSAPLEAALPGVQGLLGGVWLVAGVLGGLIVRKPGAALFTELVAASVEALVGSQWGFTTLVSGFVQGLGAEIGFAIFLYLGWRLYNSILAGAIAGLALAILDLILYYPGSAAGFSVIYVVSSIVSGAAIAGILAWFAVKALAKTGALSRFASGREARALV
jgi:energy-coupling factor transport system substrate-specific component